ncbi:MAG: hypothetical protein LC789_11145 [Actinobacteria bacterium]|nr:hypothetical protein [Actinomycetota bacterium]MCA1720665.1 hypothetical protein [Actinomycetota bacterium]
MTTPPYDDPALSKALRIYEEAPMEDGDALLLLDSKVCLELEGLADHWNAELRVNTAGMLRATARAVLVAVARPRGVLLPGDYRLWRDLHADLREDDITLLPLRALPAA